MAQTTWNSIKVKDFPHKDKLVTINENASFTTALNVLRENKILSAPVIDKNGEVTGQLDFIDLLTFLIHMSKRTQEVFVALGLVSEHQTINFSDIHVDQQLASLFSSFNVSSAISNFSKRNPFKVVNDDLSLGELARELSVNHRVSVFDANKKLQNYITQSDLIKFIYTKKELLGDKANKTVKELNLGNCDVVSIHESDHVIEAFKKMTIKAISGVAILNSQEKLVGDISAQDMREVSPESENFLELLLMPIKEYLQLQQGKKSAAETISSNATLAEVVDTLEMKKLHRLFVVDDGKLSGVISLGDVLKSLSSF